MNEFDVFPDPELFGKEHYAKPSAADYAQDDELDDLLDPQPGGDEKPSPLLGQVKAAFAKSAPCHSAPSRFPVKDVGALPIVIDPLGELDALLAELRKHGDYRAVRENYCQLSISLNLRGALAPAFRPQPKTGKRKGDSVFFEIHRDQMVIDCHWLQRKGASIKARDAEFRPMFNSAKPFPFDLAWVFAVKKWTGVHRADEALSLTPFQQCQLVTMRGKLVAGRFDAALDGVRNSGGRVPAKIAAVRQALNVWGERDRRVLPHRDAYENLWLAREVLGSGEPIRLIADLFALMTGESMRDDKTIRSKLEKMDRAISKV